MSPFSFPGCINFRGERVRRVEGRSFVGVRNVTTAQSGHCFDVEQTTTTARTGGGHHSIPSRPTPKWAGVTEKRRGADRSIWMAQLSFGPLSSIFEEVYKVIMVI